MRYAQSMLENWDTVVMKTMFTDEKYFVVGKADSGGTVWVLDGDDKRQWEADNGAHPLKVHMLGGMCVGRWHPPIRRCTC